MARRKSFLSALCGGKSILTSTMTKRFADAMVIRRSTKATKRRNSKPTAGIFH